MSFLDDMFTSNELAVEPGVVSFDRGIEAGFLYQVDSEAAVVLTLSPVAHVADLVSQRLAVKSLSGGGGITVVVPAGMQIEGAGGALSDSVDVEATPGNYREWVCNATGVWLLVAGAASSGGGGTGGDAEPNPHKWTHEAGGLDELDVTGLSGELADAQTPLAHAVTHQPGGADALVLPTQPHAATHAAGGADPIAAVPPLPHASTHAAGGSDPIVAASGPHAASHADGGSDELNVAGLAGLLAGAQRVEVARAGTLIATRKRINLIEGGGVSIVIADNDASDRVDVTIAADVSAVSEFWAAPAFAHAADVEGKTASLGPWQLVRQSDWTAITPAPEAVSGLSSPAANTVRRAYDTPPSWISLQPALGYKVALLQTFNALTRPSACQFSVRARLPVPQNGVASDTVIAFALANDLAGKPDPNNWTGFNVAMVGTNTTVVRSVQVAGGSLVGLLDSLNFDTSPMAEFEMIISCLDTTIRLFTRSGWLHYLNGAVIAGLAAAQKQHLYVSLSSANTASAPMPFAPVYQIDYLRQLDSADVF